MILLVSSSATPPPPPPPLPSFRMRRCKAALLDEAPLPPPPSTSALTCGGSDAAVAAAEAADSAAAAAASAAAGHACRLGAVTGCIGDCLRALGDVAAASQAYADSMGFLQPHAGGPDPEVPRALSVTLNKHGDLLYGAGDVAAAKQCYMRVRLRATRQCGGVVVIGRRHGVVVVLGGRSD